MNYKFAKDSLEIINWMIFDASVNTQELLNLKVQDKIQFKLERRTFEDVERKKFLFWNKAVLKGKLSELIISGVHNIEITGIGKESKSNVFVNKLIYDEAQGSLKLETAPLINFEMKVSSDFIGELVDIRDSDFGGGIYFGKWGFTKKEWNDYLREKNYQT